MYSVNHIFDHNIWEGKREHVKQLVELLYH